MKVIKITKVEKKECRLGSDIYTAKLTIPPGEHNFILLDDLYCWTPTYYDYSTASLEFHITDLSESLKSGFVSYVMENGLDVKVNQISTEDYKEKMKVLIEKAMPLRKDLIISWLKKTKVLIESEQIPVEDKSYEMIRKNLTDIESEDLSALFLIDDKAINPIASRAIPYTLSIHAKRGLNFDAIGEADLYIKLHDDVISQHVIMFNNGEPVAMKDLRYKYDLPYPCNKLYTKNSFSEEEAEQYSDLYEIFDEETEEYFGTEFGDSSKIGGYFGEDIEYACINHDPFDYERDWKSLLMICSYSHPCDFFADIGDCHADIMIIESGKDGEEVLESRIVLRYT